MVSWLSAGPFFAPWFRVPQLVWFAVSLLEGKEWEMAERDFVPSLPKGGLMTRARAGLCFCLTYGTMALHFPLPLSSPNPWKIARLEGTRACLLLSRDITTLGVVQPSEPSRYNPNMPDLLWSGAMGVRDT